MHEQVAKVQLPPIPAKRYFTIGEMSELCGVKAHVLRYWEQEFTQLKPVKRRGNRRYYQHHEVLLIRRIRELLYEEGFTISGARNRLDHPETAESQSEKPPTANGTHDLQAQSNLTQAKLTLTTVENTAFDFVAVKIELREILNLLRSDLQSS
ncbi:MAG: MerR family transcriptional regulator [Methylotenera sp.]|jgi:DNA-binding transcriptional MerR regulator|nr:MerR family transcriptional regulator [Methylotenera sp.]